jgi:hypothetical protein
MVVGFTSAVRQSKSRTCWDGLFAQHHRHRSAAALLSRLQCDFLAGVLGLQKWGESSAIL